MTHDELILSIRGQLYSYIWKKVKNINDANDLFQDVFIKLKISLDAGKWDPEKGKFVNWAFKVANGVFIDQKREEKRKSMKPFTSFDNGVMLFSVLKKYDIQEDYENEILRMELIDELMEAINRLPELQKLVIRKRFFEMKTYKEIIEEEGGCQGVWASRVRYALKRLRKRICKN